MNSIWQDIRYGIRMLAKKPLFAIVAIVTLALGIGANTAIFSVVNAVLLKSLPYPQPERLVILRGQTSEGEPDELSQPEAEDFQSRLQSFEDFTAFQSQSVNVTGGERPDRVRGSFVTSSYFKVFNLKPIIGRTLLPEEDRAGGPKVAVVNEKLWHERLGSDSNLQNKTLTLNGEVFSIVGVISKDFKQPLDPEVELWMPVTAFPGNKGEREHRFLFAMGHTKPGVTPGQANAEAETIAGQLAQTYPKENAGRSARIQLFQDFLLSDTRPLLWVLFAAVGVILLIACANLANLLLARGVGRRREIAVRAALGASRWRLVRQLVTETTIISVLGGVAGLVLAYWALYGLLQLPQTFVSVEEATLDFRVLLFALAMSLLTGWIFGLLPALQLARPQLQTFLKEGERGAGESKRWNRIRAAFVVAQVSLSLILLICAGLLLRSFDKLLRVDVGFKTEQLLSFEYRLPRNRYSDPKAQWNFHSRVLEEIQKIPGVQSASLVRGLPFSGNGGTATITLSDRELPPQGQEPEVEFNTAMPNYFQTVGIPLLQGRLFNNGDRIDSPAVVLINRIMAERFWPGQDPIGKQIKFVGDGTAAMVVGVVGNAKQYWIEEQQRPQVYVAYSQSPGFFATAVIRTTVDPTSLAEASRQAVWKVDPDQPMWKFRTVEFLVSRNVADRKFLMTLMVIFATLALVLTIIGLYGVVSYLVNQRTQEIGLRMALGAQVTDIMRMVLRQGMLLVLTGVMLGLGASWLLTRLLSRLLYQVSATDPLTFSVIAVMLTAVALLACFIPARRATKVDPLVALRYE